jgi:hypothetical protein
VIPTDGEKEKSTPAATRNAPVDDEPVSVESLVQR